MRKHRFLAIFNLLALLAHIAVSYLSQSRAFLERTIGDVSDSYNSLFTPAGITFAIWGVIYVSLLFFCIYHIRVAYRQPGTHAANERLLKIGPLFILNNLGAVGWIFAWTAQLIEASLLLIIFQLATLVTINLRLRIHDPLAGNTAKIFTFFPLSLYFGWITLATIANTSIYLVAIGWDGFGLKYSAIEWARIMIGITVFLTVLVIFARKNVVFGIVIIWALYGIILKRKSLNTDIYADLVKTAWIGLSIIGVSCIIQLLLNLGMKKPMVPSNREG